MQKILTIQILQITIQTPHNKKTIQIPRNIQIKAEKKFIVR
jgi:hypothetical protein